MILCALGLAAMAAVQTGKKEEPPDLPPFTVVITAKTGKLVPGDLAPLVNAIKQLSGTVKQISRQRSSSNLEAWYEDWKFEIPGDKKFDPTPLWNAFVRFNASRYHLTMTGTLSLEAQTKKLFITSFSGKTKVKLMNRPKGSFDDPDRKVEDTVGKLAELLGGGKLYFTVSGDIFSHGGTLAVLVETFEEADPPPPPKEEKK